jgi:H+/Cl- antiporter ClcA
MTTNTPSPTDESSGPLNSNWWYWIAAQPIATISLIIAASLNLSTVLQLSVVVLLLSYIVGLFAYLADVKAIAATDSIDWQPSRLVYVPLALIFGVLTAMFYLYKRHKHVGVP